MKLVDAYAAWTPRHATESVRSGEILIGTKVEIERDLDGPRRLQYWNGVCAGAAADPTAQAMMMFVTFNTVVVRDGIDPQTAHVQFLKIDEYRARISPDSPGAAA